MVDNYVIDRSNEWQYIDGIETLIYTPKNPDGTPVTGVKAKRSHPATAGNSGGQVLGVEPQDFNFAVWIGTMDGTIPKDGDQLTDTDGVIYIVSSFFQVPDLSQYKIFVRRTV